MLSAAPGAAAVATKSGQEAYGAWNPQLHASLETSETASHLWTAHGVRVGSGGKGAKRGGDAELIACKLKEPAKLRWLLGRSSTRSEGASGGRNGATAEIEIVRASGKKESFDTLEGVLDLAAGDEVRLHGAGGGAWGEPEAEKEKD
jgi:N-methylhydantoinase B/oxoprolinase/acetone carboxylase alpha subunit